MPGERGPLTAGIAVIGVGNPLAGDEGIACRLIAELEGERLRDGIDFIDLGTSLFSLIHVLENRKKAVIIDCALMGEAPGTIRRFTPADVRSRKNLRRFSLHEGDVLDMISLAGKVGRAVPEIILFGIEPDTTEPGRELSNALSRRLPEYKALVEAELGPVRAENADA